MAMRILVTRLVQASSATASPAGGLPMRVCVASMSSSSTPATQAPKSPATTTGQKKRESLRSRLASVFGGYVDPADPDEPPIPSDKVNFPDVTEFATGEEKLFLLAFENGILDPYCNLPAVRGDRGTKDNPVPIESFEHSRIVACACEKTQNHFKYTIVYKGEPKRCQCGHWMELVDAPRFWEQIPKEDLITIPWFRELEEEGKLDKYLQTGKLEDDHHHGAGHH